MKLQVCILIVFSFLLSMCAYDHIQPIAFETPQVDTSKICFTSDVFPIIKSNCGISGCHDDISRSGRVTLTSYGEIVKNAIPGDGKNSPLYVMTDLNWDPRMPPAPYNPLSETQRTIIRKWIDANATQNGNCK